MAALFEKDHDEISNRIGQAEKAIVQRARELFVLKSSNVEGERQALDSSLEALRALRTCQRLRGTKMAAA